jgi:hypothetical protein
MGLITSLGDPKIGRHLLRDEGEVIVDEVRKHWVVYLRPLLEVLVAAGLLACVPFLSPELGWLPMLLAGGVFLHALWAALAAHRDRFVITNMRVFRVHGVLAQHLATMPLSRILDISVVKPLHGQEQTVRLRRHDTAPWIADRPQRLRVFSGADRNDVITALAEKEMVPGSTARLTAPAEIPFGSGWHTTAYSCSRKRTVWNSGTTGVTSPTTGGVLAEP